MVQDMYNGVKAMIEAEKLLEAAVPIKAGAHLKTIEDLTGFPVFPEGTVSLLCKYLTKDIYEKFKGRKDKAGVSFE